MNCQCEELTELFGNKAEEYAKNHLQKILIDVSKWETRYRCPEKGITWIMDFPQSYLQGGGPPRLRKINNR